MAARDVATRRPEASEVDTREQLLIAVNDLIIERGLIDVSFSDIAQRSGVNSALIKYYFGNKAGLLMALLERAILPSLKQMEILLKLPDSPQDKLRKHIMGIVNTYHRYPYVNRLMHYLLAEGGDKYKTRITEELVKPGARGQEIILQEGVEKGLFRPVNPMLFYYHIIGACDHFSHGRFSLKHAFGVHSITDDLKREYVAYLCDSILNGILRKE